MLLLIDRKLLPGERFRYLTDHPSKDPTLPPIGCIDTADDITICFSECTAPDGKKVLYCHGLKKGKTQPRLRAEAWALQHKINQTGKCERVTLISLEPENPYYYKPIKRGKDPDEGYPSIIDIIERWNREGSQRDPNDRPNNNLLRKRTTPQPPQ